MKDIDYFDKLRMQEWGNKEIYSYFGFLYHENFFAASLIPFAPLKVKFDDSIYTKYESNTGVTQIEFNFKP